jgi:hypothetical protein
VRTLHLREQLEADLLLHALLVQPKPISESGEEWVCGIVVENPFRSRRRSAPDGLPEQLFDTDLLVCSLGSWHPLAWPKQRYYLRRIESAWSSDVLVVNVAADWHDTRKPDSVAELPVRVLAPRGRRKPASPRR